ncbi:hypothetical protein [Cyclobacterium xiamenense]|jgi:hypothetical protein|nr:hypothetical protein [Cyclobacterium xiamenense]
MGKRLAGIPAKIESFRQIGYYSSPIYPIGPGVFSDFILTLEEK